jgi:multicomponent K+:H+ antiporter subunit D
MGLNGAFVTGDLFNLFVFFEVLLIASYVLMLHGQGRSGFRVGMHYVVLNLAASALFLIGVSLLYAVTGTLNMADLALRVPLVTGPDAVLLQAAALHPAGGVRLQGGAAAAVAVAAGHLCRIQRAGGGAVCDHDQGGRLRHLARARRHLRRLRAGASASRGRALAAAAGAGHQRAGVLGALAAHTLPRLVAWLTVASVGTILARSGCSARRPGRRRCTTWRTARWWWPGCSCWSNWWRRSVAMPASRLEPAAPVAQPVLLGLLLLLAAASAWPACRRCRASSAS